MYKLDEIENKMLGNECCNECRLKGPFMISEGRHTRSVTIRMIQFSYMRGALLCCRSFHFAFF